MLILYMFKVRTLRQAISMCTVRRTITTHHLPEIEPAYQGYHANANKQENEHLPIACTAQLNTHLLLLSRSSWLKM